MKAHVVRDRACRRSAAIERKTTHPKGSFTIPDHRPHAIHQRAIQKLADDSFQAKCLQTLAMRMNKNVGARKALPLQGATTRRAFSRGEAPEGMRTIQRRVHVSHPLQLWPIPFRPSGYTRLPVDREIDAFGKGLVESYRLIKDATQAIKAKKNREGLKICALGLIDAGISLGTVMVGVPGFFGIGEGGLAITANTQTLAASGAHTGVGLVEPQGMPSTRTLAFDVEGFRQSDIIRPATTKEAIKKVARKKFGSKAKTAKTFVSLIPFVSAIEKIYKGGKLLKKSQTQYRSEKNHLIECMQDLLEDMEDKLNDIDLAAWGDQEIQTANSKIFLRHKTRTLQDLVDKYRAKCKELRKAIEDFDKAPDSSSEDETLSESEPFLEATHTSTSTSDEES